MGKWFPILLRVLCAGVLFFGSSRAWCAPESPCRPVTIGLIDTFSPRFYLRAFVPTIEYLERSLSGCGIRVVEISPSSLSEEIQKEKPDFLISSSWHYSLLAAQSGAQQIVTKKNRWAEDPRYSVAATLIVRADRADLRSMRDLKGKTVAASSPEDFAEWLVALGVVAKAGYDPDNYFGTVRFTHYRSPSVSSLVKLGIADVGVLPMCELERLVRSGDVTPEEFRVLNAQETGPCARSSQLYPDAVFSRMPWADMESVRRISIALLSMQDQSLSFDWLPASGFLNVTDLMKSLRQGPYSYLRDMTLRGFLSRHREAVGLAGMLFLFLLIHVIRANWLVHRRTLELREQSDRRLASEMELRQNREKLHLLEKNNTVAQMSAMFAHELKQPLTRIIYYASALKRMAAQFGELEKSAVDRIIDNAKRTAEVVEHVRGYVRAENTQRQFCRPSEILSIALRQMEDGQGKRVDVQADESAGILADPFEIELILLNLLKNAFSAAGRTEAEVRCIIAREGDFCKIRVEDNGPRISDEQFASLGFRTRSAKRDGLGIGLPICKAILENYGSDLVFERLEPHGLAVWFTLPLYTGEGGHG